MAMERRNPLPVGHYWIHLDRDDAPSFDAWRVANSPNVFTKTTTHNADDGWTWYLFDVRSTPVPWDAESWGWPTIADPHVTSETDVVQLPPPEPGWVDRAQNAIDSVGKGTLLTLGGIAVAAVVLNKLLK